MVSLSQDQKMIRRKLQCPFACHCVADCLVLSCKVSIILQRLTHYKMYINAVCEFNNNKLIPSIHLFLHFTIFLRDIAFKHNIFNVYHNPSIQCSNLNFILKTDKSYRFFNYKIISFS